MENAKPEKPNTTDQAGEVLGKMLAYVLIVGLLVLLARIAIIPFRLIRTHWKETRAAKLVRQQANGRFYFWLTDSEKYRFKAVYRNLAEAESHRAQTIKIADDNGIPKDANGRYNGSTEIGARVSTQMETLNSIIRDAKQEIESEQSRPLKEWEAFNTMLRKKRAAAVSQVVFGLSIYPLSVAILDRLPPGDFMQILGILLGWCTASGIAGLSYHILRKLLCAPASAIFAKPPQVTLANIDDWNHQAEDVGKEG